MLGNETKSATSELPALAARLRALQPGYPEGRFAGRGIVIAAGGRTMFTNAYVLVSILRRTLGCTLPIELWHFGPSKLSASMAAALEPFGVRLVDAGPRAAEAGVELHDGWQLKPFALQWSGFAEVLMLDADQVPVRDPRTLFDWPEYRAAGAVFWPDIVHLSAGNLIWSGLGLPAESTVSFESGQILVDKRRHWRALSIVLGLNEAAEQVCELVYGDKDTFLVGWALADAEHAVVPFPPLYDEGCLIQRDFAGEPLFQHRTNAKWNYSGEQYEIEGFELLPACLAALDELREVWNGVVFNAPDRTAAARAAEGLLVAGGPLRLEIGTEDGVALDLRRFGEIGAGRAFDRQNWWCAEEDGEMSLFLREAARPTYRMRRVTGDRWEGRRLRQPASLAVLTRPDAGVSQAPVLPGLVEELLRAAGFPASSPDDLVRLGGALILLERVEPGVAAALANHAARHPDPRTAAALRALAEQIPVGVALNPVARDTSILDRGYHSPFYRAD
jgi:hypothetical protein